jgi:hypothetical protein
MKDTTLIAREIQDLAGSFAESMASVADTVKAGMAVTVASRQISEGQAVQLQMPAPVIQLPPPNIDVTVNVPEGPAPIVNVAAPTVNVASPSIHVEAAQAVGYEVTITRRDKDGFIQSFVIVPVEFRE